MLEQQKISRLNELARKKKAEGLTEDELSEQAELRKEYIENLRSGFRNHIEGLKIVDEEGNDVTPEKVKAIQRKKGLHNRHLD
ncbi:DUF896 family protein [Tuanshanicoccus lijuaniae]|uniref:DUF896 family protein n=1 Tax=Aerococcaceae bacterium zg-1292 TaxID=2774330 RepID=UPI00193635A1|nr:DUF896 family protein [Aerococcaceae bacterium zg-1292]MBF6625721.1 DUF896 family protein [Aerococcaceae bacterium zg-BR9]MBF6978707.1 DUF896 family protein [Aerococcaceae bacterium zg-BR22]QQA37701.1 DUF896 family protein [Aerococcaceae bacterium zg-1292]